MDVLRESAEETFENIPVFSRRTKFEDTDKPLWFHQTRLSNGQSIRSRTKISKEDIASKMKTRDSTVVGERKLAQITMEDPFPMRLKKRLLKELIESLDVDLYILHLIVHNSYGFHRFPATDAPVNGTKGISSFFLSTILYMLVWSFNPATTSTKALLMIRKTDGLDTEVVRSQFDLLLEMYDSHIYSPGCLSLVAGTQLVHFLDKYITFQLEAIWSVESRTGYGQMSENNNKTLLTMDDVTTHSKEMGMSLGVLANLNRHLSIARETFAHVSKTFELKQDEDTSMAGKKKDVMNVARILETQITWNEKYVEYLLERAKSQMVILQSLRSHEDAQVSINLTRISLKLTEESIELARQASRIADATKKDSTILKTIAFLTMAFLPATFFAALFAVPLLKWDEGNVIQKRFWVYWAFTLPTTAAVFIAQNVVTRYGKEIKKKLAV